MVWRPAVWAAWMLESESSIKMALSGLVPSLLSM